MGKARISRGRRVKPSAIGEDSAATDKQRYLALMLATLLVVVASCATLLGQAAGPASMPFIPIVATVWSLADILTGFLLLTQFYISGRLLFGILAFAYGVSGMMTIPFILVFPGLFGPAAPDLPMEQMPAYLWTIWHFAFTILVIVAGVTDAKLDRIVSRRKKIAVTSGIAALVPVCAFSVSAGCYALRATLPLLSVHGVFQPAFRLGVLPSLVALNVLATCLFLRRRPLTLLALWLAVATLAAALDALLIAFGAARYSYAWYAGRLIYVFTSSNVLLALLWDIACMYGRLSRVERTDPLTSLPTRYAFEDRLRSLFHDARRRPASLGLLIVAVDTFERYAATYGEMASDECFQRIARELLDCAPRPVDFVARYGSGEYVLLLPDTDVVAARVIAERIRSIVERLEIVAGGQTFGRVTVSIGIGFTNDLRGTSEQKCFDAADRALHEAIGRGRNRVMLAYVEAAAFEDEPAPLIAVSVGSALR